MLLEKADKIYQNYLAVNAAEDSDRADMDSVFTAEQMLLDAACFSPGRTKKFIDQIQKLTRDWYEEDQLDQAISIIDGLEARLSNEIPHRDDATIQLDAIMGGIGN